MRRLFWKIFLSFWLAMILIVGVFAWVNHTLNLRFEGSPLPERLEFVLRSNAETAAGVLRRGGREALTRWLRRGRFPRMSRVLVFDPKGFELLNRPLPRPLKHLREIGQPPNVLKSDRYYALSARDSDGDYYRIAAISTLPPGPLFSAGREGVLLRLAIAVVVSALICVLLARSITARVNRVRWAAREISSGNLGARVGPQARGNDELAELAGDFDSMAARLEGALESQRQLLLDLSHELRSPLARLQVATELARKRFGRSEAPELDRIEQEAERLNELIGQILNLSREDQEQRPLKREPTDLAALLRELAERNRVDSGAPAIEVDAPAGLELALDPPLIERALENVLRNALRHSPPGETITVTLAPRDGGAEVKIADRGPGVAEDQLERIFKPFYRVGAARDRESGGYGLGLAIAKAAVERHDGQISAHNRPGGGLEVRLLLPPAGPDRTL